MKTFIMSACAFLMLTTTAAWAVQPYDTIRQLPYEPYYLHNAWLVTNAMTSRSGTVFIDGGSASGGAARYMAQNTDGSVAIYSIDPWLIPGSYQLFLSNVIQENNTDKITPLRLSSKEAAEGTQIIADVIYLNGTNNYILGQQIVQWFSHLSSNGAICGDGWNFQDTSLAVTKSADKLGLTIEVNGTFWIVHR